MEGRINPDAMADMAGHDERFPPGGAHQTAAPEGAEKKSTLPPLRFIDPCSWRGAPPAREWTVQDWIPRGVVTGLYGDGGVGKSLLAQQLLHSVAIGAPWLGLPVQPGRALGIFCEDDERELWRRQEAINAMAGTSMSDLGRLRLVERVGMGNDLMHFTGAIGSLTPFHDQVMALCDDFRPDCVVFDTAADLYPDNEMDRPKVRRFVQDALGSVARRFSCSVVLCAHPSVRGMNDGTGASGSTAWNNTMRSRLYLTRPPKDDTDGRMLARPKANYAPLAGDMKLRWQSGVLVPVSKDPTTGYQDWSNVGRMFDEIERAWTAKRPWSLTPQSKNTGRWFPAWAKDNLSMPEDEVRRLVQGWLTTEHLVVDCANRNTSLKGLRVQKRLEPV